MIKIENLSYSYPEKDLYHKISFTLEDDQHCAFIGSNGTGKSTLIDIIMNPEEYLYDGKVIIDKNCRIGYVSQFSNIDKTKEITVFDFLAEEYIRLQNEITSICTEMETSSDIETLMDKYQEALDAFDAIGGDDYESNITKKLNLANLDRHKDLLLSKLSGGEFKLIQVIKEMLTAPNLMIMDEPDVFLDFEHLTGLENLINSHKGMMLVITHNRYLLNHCFNKIIHLENKELQEFDGTYVEYNFTLLQTKIELQELAAADTAEIERLEKLVDKMRNDATIHTCATRGRALHAKVSQLERLEARRIKAPFVDIKQPEISLLTENILDEETTALTVTDYSLSFEHLLLENVNIEIGAHDKVALIGENGTGKTTLLRDIFKNQNETIKLDENIETAFLSQYHGEMFNESNTIMNEFLDLGMETMDAVRAHLSNYGFEGDILDQRISALSGGEKNLLQLAKISLGNANLLLLDEPTSHLDTYSQIALENALINYNGAILMISHDFYTIANSMDYVLMVENKTIRKMSIRKFRKMIYANHFDKDYLEIEQKKQEMETRVALALKDNDFEKAKGLTEQLEGIIKQM